MNVPFPGPRANTSQELAVPSSEVAPGQAPPPSDSPPEEAANSPLRKWLPLVATCLGTFLLLIYATIVTVALPSMSADLHASFGSLQWIVDTYTLALAGLLLGMGALGDNLGRKRLYVLGLIVFTVATLACGMATTAGVLITARAVQGVAGAAMFATLLPLIGLTYRGGDRAKAFAIWGAVAGAAAGIGNVAGGMLTQFLSWPWIFYGAVPICAATIALSVTVLVSDPRAARRIDYPGIATFTLASSAITFGFIRGGEQGWGATSTLVGFMIGACMLVTFIMVENLTADPMIPMKLFRKPAFNGMLIAACGYYLAAFGALPVLSIWLQDSVGLSSFSTSLVITVQPLAFFITSLVGSTLHRLPAVLTLGGGTVIVGLGNLALLTVGPGSSWPVLIPGLVVTGVGAGIVSPVLPAIAMSSAPESHSGVAAAAANSARQLGLSLGIAVFGTLFHQYASAIGGTVSHAADADGLDAVFLLGTVVGLVSGVVAILLLTIRRQTAAAETLRAGLNSLII